MTEAQNAKPNPKQESTMDEIARLSRALYEAVLDRASIPAIAADVLGSAFVSVVFNHGMQDQFEAMVAEQRKCLDLGAAHKATYEAYAQSTTTH